MLHTLLRSRLAYWLVAAALAVLAVLYIGKGARQLFNPDPMVGATDLNRRWVEDRYVFRHQNPFDVGFANDSIMAKYAPPGQALVTRNSTLDPELGDPEGVVYPPWTYPLTMLYLWVPFGMARPWYLGVMIAALLSIAGVAAAAGPRAPGAGPHAGRFALLMGIASLALSSWAFAIYGGNFPTVVVASLMLAWFFDERKHPLPAGFFLAMALIKPSVAAPFFLAMVIKRRWGAVLACLVTLGIASGITWSLTQTPPWEMLGQMSAASARWVGNSAGPIQSMIAVGIARKAAIQSLLLVFGGLGFAGMLLCRKQSLLVLFALAAVTARLWSYHYNYDDNCLLPLLLAWSFIALKQKTRWANSILLAVALTLMLPPRVLEPPVLFWAQQLVWLCAGGALVIHCLGKQVEKEPAGTTTAN